MTVDRDTRERVAQAVTAAMQEAFSASVPDTPEEWRRDAEAVTDAALNALREDQS